MNRQRLLDRFLRYVSVDTTANDRTEEYPSSPGQRQLGGLLREELERLGLAGVRQDEHGLVHGLLPGSGDQVVVLNAHLDTSPETSGENVRPQVVERYEGGDLQLPGNPALRITVKDNPELAQLHGCTLVTTDGTTLLGGDDKAGVAVIMEVVEHLVEHPEQLHAPLRVLFTCDEEIGRGVRHVDVPQLGAAVGYTLDGGGADTIDVETFSADLATVTVEGVNIHPSIAKGRMVNAVRGAAEFLAHLPPQLAPERTSQREGFLHPYQVEGGVERVTLKILLRDFETSNLAAQAALLQEAAAATVAALPGCRVDVQIQPQYRNLGDGLAREPRAVAYAVEAHRRLGRTAAQTIIRGGTDGSLFTALGLPMPNLATGQHNPHSPLEWACLDEMLKAGEVVLELLRLWAEDPGAAGDLGGR